MEKIEVRGIKATKEIEFIIIKVYAKDIDGDFKKWCKRNILGSTIIRIGIFMKKTTDEYTCFELTRVTKESLDMVKWLGGLCAGKGNEFPHTEIRLKPYLGTIIEEPLTKEEIKYIIMLFNKKVRQDRKELILGCIFWTLIKGFFKY